MLVISKVTTSRDRGKTKPQQTKLTQKTPQTKTKDTHTENNKILPKINLKTSFHEMLVMMYKGFKFWSSARLNRNLQYKQGFTQ